MCPEIFALKIACKFILDLRKFKLLILYYFYPFVLSVDGLLGKEAHIVLANLSQLMAEKMEEPILHMCSWFNGLIVIAVAQSYSLMIRGYRLTRTL